MNTYSALARRNDRMKRTALICFLVGIVLGIAGSLWWAFGTEQTRVCTVTGKHYSQSIIVSEGEGRSTSEYRVETAECGVLRVDDVPLRFRWNSADVYASLAEGQRYELTTVGWRNGFFSWFPVIIEAVPA